MSVKIEDKSKYLPREERMFKKITGLSQKLRIVSINFISEKFRKRSKLTKNKKIYILSRFFTFLESEKLLPDGPEEFGKYQILAYLNFIENEKQLSSGTVAAYGVTIKQFYQFLFDEEYINDIRVLKHLDWDQPKSTPTPELTQDEVRTLLTKQYDRHQFFLWEALRDKFIITLLLYTSMRRSEVCRIKIGDIRRTKEGGGAFLNILCKRKKIHTYPFGPEFGFYLDSYLEDCRLMRKVNKPTDFLLFSRRKKNLTGAAVYEIFKRRCKEFGIYGKSPHSCRVTCATVLLHEKNVSIRKVADIMGHKHTTTTDGYYRQGKFIENEVSYKEKRKSPQLISQSEYEEGKDLKQ
jgi:integrase/recombinase XerD